MNKKIACLILICVAALPIVYACSNLTLFAQETHIKNVSPKPVALTEDLLQQGKLSYPAPIPTGDPVDNPIPHKQ